MKYAEETQVSVARSKAEIEDLLIRYGATSFATGWANNGAIIGFELEKRSIKFHLPLPDRAGFKERKDRYGYKRAVPAEKQAQLYEQACRTAWRGLLLCIKAKLTSAASGITTLEQEFLAHFVTPSGQTLGDILIPQLDRGLDENATQKLLGIN